MSQDFQPCRLRRVCAVLLLILWFAPARRSSAGQQGADSQSELRAELVAKLEVYQARLKDLVPFYERALKTAGDKLATRKQLYQAGLISRVELEETERAMADASRQLDATREQVTQSDEMIAEVRLADELDKQRDLADHDTVIRFEGSVAWSLAKRGPVEEFFSEQFGYTLPVSALGQTTLHERMGFSHFDAMDVAVHPDSAEGRRLMEYLRNAGIPFIAFRSAVPGSATGAHIHVGRPSLRLAASA
jgi:hypothetical protein